MEKYKQVNRNIRFDSRELSSPYRCKFGDKNMFDAFPCRQCRNGIRRNDVYDRHAADVRIEVVTLLRGQAELFIDKRLGQLAVGLGRLWQS
jgi:hypothetical protein